MNTCERMCAFFCFTMILCVFLERVLRVCQNGIPQRRAVKIIIKFSACFENQGILLRTCPLLRQVLRGFLLKRCLGISNGRGAFSYSLLCTPQFYPEMMDSCCEERSCSILGKAERCTTCIDNRGQVLFPLHSAEQSQKRDIYQVLPTSHRDTETATSTSRWTANKRLTARTTSFIQPRCEKRILDSVVYKTCIRNFQGYLIKPKLLP